MNGDLISSKFLHLITANSELIARFLFMQIDWESVTIIGTHILILEAFTNFPKIAISDLIVLFII